MNLTVDPKDLQCGVCYRRYSDKTNQPMIVSCGHSLCSACIPRLRTCPHCREVMQGTPVKNLLVLSFLEKDSQTEKCSLHEKSQDHFSEKRQKYVCSDCILEEHSKEYKSVDEIKRKVSEIREQKRKIHEKKMEANSITPELLKKRNCNLIDTLFDEEIALFSSLKKKIKRLVDTIDEADAEQYKQTLSVGDLERQEQKIETMLEKYKKNPGDGKLIAEIFEVPLQTRNSLQKYDDQKKMIINKIDEEGKAFEKNIQQSKLDLNLVSNAQKFLNKLYKNTSQKLHPKYSLKIAKDYLLETFEDYGLKSEIKGQDESIFLRENISLSYLKKFDPQLFECSLEKLHLVCDGKISNPKFQILCDILQNIQKLSDLNTTFEDSSLENIELLSSVVLKSKTLQKFSIQQPLLISFEKLTGKIFLSKKVLSIDIHPVKMQISIGSEKNSAETLQEFTLKFPSLNQFFDFVKQSIQPRLKSSSSIKTLRLSAGVNNAQYLCDILQIVKDLKTLQELDLMLDNVWQDQNLPSQISQALITSTHITKVNLFLAGKGPSNKVFDSIFGDSRTPPANHKLEVFNLTIMQWDEVDFQKVIYFLRNFSKLKTLALINNQVSVSFSQLRDFMKTLRSQIEIQRYLKNLFLFALILRVSFDQMPKHKEVDFEPDFSMFQEEFKFWDSEFPASIWLSFFKVEMLRYHHQPDLIEIKPKDKHQDGEQEGLNPFCCQRVVRRKDFNIHCPYIQEFSKTHNLDLSRLVSIETR